MISRYLGIEKSQPVSKPCTNSTAVLLYIRCTAQRYVHILYRKTCTCLLCLFFTLFHSDTKYTYIIVCNDICVLSILLCRDVSPTTLPPGGDASADVNPTSGTLQFLTGVRELPLTLNVLADDVPEEAEVCTVL